MFKNIANFFTLMRIIFSVLLIFLKKYSILFFCFYVFAGLTDVFDGFFARKLKITSDFGEKFDTFSDFIFFGISITILFFKINVSVFVWVLVCFCVLLKIVCILLSFFKTKKIIIPHSVFNKLSGVVIFVIPFFINIIDNNFLILTATFFVITLTICDFFSKTQKNT